MALIVTGARALIKLGGDVFIFAAGVSVTHENRLEEIPQLDMMEVGEYAENGHRCEISINSFKLAPDASIGGQPLANNGNQFLFDDPIELKKILLQPEFIIEVVDTTPVRDGSGNITDYSETAIYVGYGAKFAGGTGQLDARGVWQGNWNFKCRRGTGI